MIPTAGRIVVLYVHTSHVPLASAEHELCPLLAIAAVVALCC